MRDVGLALFIYVAFYLIDLKLVDSVQNTYFLFFLKKKKCAIQLKLVKKSLFFLKKTFFCQKLTFFNTLDTFHLPDQYISATFATGCFLPLVHFFIVSILIQKARLCGHPVHIFIALHRCSEVWC